MAENRISYGSISSSCANIKNITLKLNTTISNINEAINKIQDPVWSGTAASAYKEKIKLLVDNLPDANRQLALSVLFLASCADGYKSIDKESVNSLIQVIGEDYILEYDINGE